MLVTDVDRELVDIVDKGKNSEQKIPDKYIGKSLCTSFLLCCNKFSLTQLFKTTQIYITVLEGSTLTWALQG